MREAKPLEPPTRPPEREDCASASSGITAPASIAAATMLARGRATFCTGLASSFWARTTTALRRAMGRDATQVRLASCIFAVLGRTSYRNKWELSGMRCAGCRARHRAGASRAAGPQQPPPRKLGQQQAPQIRPAPLTKHTTAHHALSRKWSWAARRASRSWGTRLPRLLWRHPSLIRAWLRGMKQLQQHMEAAMASLGHRRMQREAVAPMSRRPSVALRWAVDCSKGRCACMKKRSLRATQTILACSFASARTTACGWLLAVPCPTSKPDKLCQARQHTTPPRAPRRSLPRSWRAQPRCWA